MSTGYRIIDLTHRLEEGMPMTRSLPRFVPWWYSKHSWGDKVSFQAMVITEHTGTNVDAPRHIHPEGKTFDDLPLDLFIGSAIVLDLRHIEPKSEVTIDDLRAAEEKNSSTINAGDIVLLMYGFDDRGWELVPSLYDTYLRDRPVLSLEAAEYLVEKGIKGIGSDTHGPDKSGPRLPLHEYILGEEVLLFEALTHLDQIKSDRCLFIGFPLHIKEATGSPIRAVALVGDLSQLVSS